MSKDHSTKHILQSLVMNLAIATAKGAAAAITGSGAMLAETIHSAADCANQLLLLLGVKRSARPPSDRHPLGYGRDLYFWSFMVAMLLFCGGGAFSIYEGIHKLSFPEPVHWVGLGIAILLFSLLLEGYATSSNIQEMNRRRGETPLEKYLTTTKDSDLVVVFGENLAATLGLLCALPALILSWWTGDTWWDAAGSIVIGLVLILVSVFLAIEVKSLLIGESADTDLEKAVDELVDASPKISRCLRYVSVQQGPGQVLLLLKLSFEAGMSVESVCEEINRFETELRRKREEIRWCFIEPDIERVAA